MAHGDFVLYHLFTVNNLLRTEILLEIIEVE